MLQKTPTDVEAHAFLSTWLRETRAADMKKIETLQQEIKVHRERERLLKKQTRKTRADLHHITQKLQDCNGDLIHVVAEIEMYFADVAPA